MHVEVDELVVVEARTPQRRVVDVESERFDQVE
jgi:hypothetical protein